MSLINELLDNLEKRGDKCLMSIGIRVLYGEANFCGRKGVTCGKCQEQAKAMLDELRKKLNNNGWIPVTERLPENEEKVLVYLNDGMVAILRYNHHKLPFNDKCIGWGYESPFFKIDFEKQEVIAWMPLPIPYKGGEEE